MHRRTRRGRRRRGPANAPGGWRSASRHRGPAQGCPSASAPARRRDGSSIRSARRCGRCATRSCDQAHLVDQQAARVLDPGDAAAGRQRLRPDGGGGPAGQQQREFAQARDEACRHAGGGPAVQRADQRVGLAAAPARRSRRARRARSGGGRTRGRRRTLPRARPSTRRDAGRRAAACRGSSRSRLRAGRGIVVAHPADEACGGGRPGVEPAVELGQRLQRQPFVGVDAERRERDALARSALVLRAGARVGRRASPKRERSARGRDRVVARLSRRSIAASRAACARRIRAPFRPTPRRCNAPARRAPVASPAAAAQASSLAAACERPQIENSSGTAAATSARVRPCSSERATSGRVEVMRTGSMRPVAHAQADAQLAFKAHGRLARQARTGSRAC